MLDLSLPRFLPQSLRPPIVVLTFDFIIYTSPSWINRKPSPIDEAPVAQAVADVLEGPINLYLIEIFAVGILLRTWSIVILFIFSNPP